MPLRSAVVGLLFLTSLHSSGSGCGSGGCATASAGHGASHASAPSGGHPTGVGTNWSGGAVGHPAATASGSGGRISFPQATGGGFHPAATPLADVLADVGATLVEAAAEAVGSGLQAAFGNGEPPVGVPQLSCRSVADCGEGALGHGSVCDRVSHGGHGDADEIGLCRDACRTPADCIGPAACLPGLDPMDLTWRACVPSEDRVAP